MMHATPVLLCAICLAALLPPNEAAALFPAMKQRLALQQQEQKAHQQKSDEEAAIPAVVPEPVDVGADGFPSLPDVSKILGSATIALKTVNNQANAIEARVVAAQKQIQGKLGHQKKAFEFQLKSQETQNLALKVQNSKVSAEILTLHDHNVASRVAARDLQKSNRMLRSEIHTLESKLGVAKEFASKTLKVTDDSKEVTLNVLHMASKAPQKDVVETNDEDDDDDDDSGNETDVKAASLLQKPQSEASALDDISLLQISQSEASALDDVSDESSTNPDDLLASLTKDVAHLAAQKKASEKNLREIFIRDFRAGAMRHKAIMAEQKVLKKKRGDAQQLKQKLQKAVAHLQVTHLQLTRRLHGLGQFMKQLAHLALAQETEMPELMQKLPKAVTIAKHHESTKPLV